MQKELRNSVSLTGNISQIKEEKENINGRKYLFFDICQNNKYVTKEGEEREDKQYFSFKLYPKELEQYRGLLEVGKWVHILGYIHAYIDKNGFKHNYIVVNQIKEMKNENEIIDNEIFDYDWLNNDEEK